MREALVEAHASAGLGKLRPVTFRYKAEPATGSRPLEYGLIAEEVAEIYPELVVGQGRPAFRRALSHPAGHASERAAAAAA